MFSLSPTNTCTHARTLSLFMCHASIQTHTHTHTHALALSFSFSFSQSRQIKKCTFSLSQIQAIFGSFPTNEGESQNCFLRWIKIYNVVCRVRVRVRVRECVCVRVRVCERERDSRVRERQRKSNNIPCFRSWGRY